MTRPYCRPHHRDHRTGGKQGGWICRRPAIIVVCSMSTASSSHCSIAVRTKARHSTRRPAWGAADYRRSPGVYQRSRVGENCCVVPGTAGRIRQCATGNPGSIRRRVKVRTLSGSSSRTAETLAKGLLMWPRPFRSTSRDSYTSLSARREPAPRRFPVPRAIFCIRHRKNAMRGAIRRPRVAGFHDGVERMSKQVDARREAERPDPRKPWNAKDHCREAGQYPHRRHLRKMRRAQPRFRRKRARPAVKF